MAKIKRTFILLIVIVLLVGAVGVSSAEDKVLKEEKSKAKEKIDIFFFDLNMRGKMFVNFFEKFYKQFLKLSLPKSLDKLYEGSVPETPGNAYLGQMFKTVGAFDGIVVNLQENDIANAKVNYKQFSDEYNKMSNMVPKWKGFYRMKLVDQLGKDLDSNNVPKAFEDIGKIGESCDRCHRDVKPQVWAKYYWRDFDTVNITTPEGNMTWHPAMAKYLATPFEGIVVNGAENKWTESNKSYQLFKIMFGNLRKACNNCHKTPR